MFDNVLVFAAHPDDEVIGCGGTLRKIANAGGQITVVVVAGGATGVSPAYAHIADIAAVRRSESDQTKDLLGITDLVFLGHKTQEVVNSRELFHQFIRTIRAVKPQLVLTHAPDDKHRDHRAVAEVTREAVWKAWENVMPDLGARHRVAETWHYEVTDPLDDVDILVDISETLEYKLKAIRAHLSQQEILAGIENLIQGLAMARGFIIETPYAEAFKVCNIVPREVRL